MASASLTRVNGREPKKPRKADNGDGWAVMMTLWRLSSINGIRHAFAGAEPKLRYSYMGNQANTYDMRNVQDKTHFVLSIGGETEIAKGWSIGGDASFTRGRHDKDFSCSVTVKRMW